MGAYRDRSRQRLAESEHHALAVVVYVIIDRGDGEDPLPVDVAERHACRRQIVPGIGAARGSGGQWNRHRASRNRIQANRQPRGAATLRRRGTRRHEGGGDRGRGQHADLDDVLRGVGGAHGARGCRATRIDGRDGQREGEPDLGRCGRRGKRGRERIRTVDRHTDATRVGLRPPIRNLPPPRVVAAAAGERHRAAGVYGPPRSRVCPGSEGVSGIVVQLQVAQRGQAREHTGRELFQQVVVQPEGFQTGKAVEYSWRQRPQRIVGETQIGQTGESGKVIRLQRCNAIGKQAQRPDLAELLGRDRSAFAGAGNRRDNRIPHLVRTIADPIRRLRVGRPGQCREEQPRCQARRTDEASRRRAAAQLLRGCQRRDRLGAKLHIYSIPQEDLQRLFCRLTVAPPVRESGPPGWMQPTARAGADGSVIAYEAVVHGRCQVIERSRNKVPPGGVVLGRMCKPPNTGIVAIGDAGPSVWTIQRPAT